LYDDRIFQTKIPLLFVCLTGFSQLQEQSWISCFNSLHNYLREEFDVENLRLTAAVTSFVIQPCTTSDNNVFNQVLEKSIETEISVVPLPQNGILFSYEHTFKIHSTPVCGQRISGAQGIL
jgi:hypothetical protein